MRGIDCAHSRTVKTLPWPWFWEGIDVLKIFAGKTPIGVILCVKSIERILIPSLNQGQGNVFTVRECAQSIPRLKNLRIDGFLIKIRKCLIFASIHPPPSMNQGQGSVITLRECAQSIPRIKLPLEGHLLKKLLGKIFFGDRAANGTPFNILYWTWFDKIIKIELLPDRFWILFLYKNNGQTFPYFLPNACECMIIIDQYMTILLTRKNILKRRYVLKVLNFTMFLKNL